MGVPFGDKDGAQALRTLIAQGARIEKCSGFLKHLLQSKAGAPCEGISASEAELLQRLRGGDEAAFDELVRRFGGRMLSVARRLLGSEDDARDAVQEAFLAAFASIHDFNGTSMLSTWMHRIVVNAGLMQLRRRRRKPEHSIDELLPRFIHGEWAEDPISESITMESLLELRDSRRRVQLCISKLPEFHRAVLVLRDIEGLDTAETAVRLGISANGVKVRLHRARQALRTLLEGVIIEGRNSRSGDEEAARVDVA
jgi:RNA polymerase sigma-70 factor (ECF subfamily)